MCTDAIIRPIQAGRPPPTWGIAAAVEKREVGSIEAICAVGSRMLSLLSLLLLLLASSSSVVFFVDAYIPAVPTNATSGDQSIVLELRWNNGEYR